MADFGIEDAEWVLLDQWYAVVRNSMRFIQPRGDDRLGASVTWLNKDSQADRQRFCARLNDIRAFRCLEPNK